jgi:DNA-binding NarL/FixJ family response regulator
VRILIADDSALIRDGLRTLLPRHGIELTDAVADAPALLESIAHHPPDVALIDIRMPPTYTGEGIDAAIAVRDRFPRVGVLVLSQVIDPDYAMGLIKTHPTRSGYLLKDRITEIEMLAAAIRRVHDGQCVIDPELVELLLQRPAARSRLAELTAREREVLGMLAEGLTDAGIAERLWLTRKTVETHIRHILSKLNLPNDASYNRRVLAVLTYLREDQQ